MMAIRRRFDIQHNCEHNLLLIMYNNEVHSILPSSSFQKGCYEVAAGYRQVLSLTA